MNEFERHVFTLPRLARPRHAHDTLAHTHARAPCSRTNALCKLRAELDRVFARLRPHKVDSASEPPSLPFRHVLCPRTPPSHGTCSRMRPCLSDPVKWALACARASCLAMSRAVVQARMDTLLGAAQASRRLTVVSPATRPVARVRQLRAAPYSPLCCGAATASLPRVEQPEPSEYTAHDRHRRSLLCNAVRGSAPGESLAGPQQH